MTKWHEQRVLAVDTETSGINPLEERVVTAALVHMTPGQRPRPMTYVIDPGIDIPAEAAEVHGWTRDRVLDVVGGPGQAQRTAISSTGVTYTQIVPREVALYEIAGQLGHAMGHGTAVVVHNAAYDLTLLETEFARHDIDTLASRPLGIRGVVDPMVIEKAFDPFRKVNYKDAGGCRGGKVKCGGCGAVDKKLESLCAHYGVRHAGAHDASADAVACVRLVLKLVAAWPEMARWKLPTLHAHQVTWRREQADSLRAYFDMNGIEHDGVDPGWPVYTALTAVPVGVAS